MRIYRTKTGAKRAEKNEVNKFKTASKPDLEASQELLDIAKFMCKTDKESFIGVFELWAVKWTDFLKERTVDRHTGKTHYTHHKLRSAYLSMKRNMPYLWTWYDWSERGIPNTNNGLEGKFTDLKTKLRNHNGLSIKHRMIFIDAYFKGTYR
ncbi:MAG: transposase [Alistipes sp.]